MKQNLSLKPPIIISMVLLLLAVFPFPYGYYMFLRLVVCLTSGFLAWFCYKAKKITWVWIMAFTALFFNPIIPLRFGRELWLTVDVLTAIIFGIFLAKNKGEV